MIDQALKILVISDVVPIDPHVYTDCNKSCPQKTDPPSLDDSGIWVISIGYGGYSIQFFSRFATRLFTNAIARCRSHAKSQLAQVG